MITEHDPNPDDALQIVNFEEAEQDIIEINAEKSQDDVTIDQVVPMAQETKRKRGRPLKVPTKRGRYIWMPKGVV